jgi:hypothetical protein
MSQVGWLIRAHAQQPRQGGWSFTQRLAPFPFQERPKHMKQLVLVAVFITLTSTLHAGWFNQPSRQEQALQQQLIEQRANTGRWQAAAFVLGIATVGSLVIGAAIGSKGRRDAHKIP